MKKRRQIEKEERKEGGMEEEREEGRKVRMEKREGRKERKKKGKETEKIGIVKLFWKCVRVKACSLLPLQKNKKIDTKGRELPLTSSMDH